MQREWEDDPQRTWRGTRSERLACITALALLGCIALTLGSCGGGDFTIGGSVPVIPSDAELPTETP